mmetsp:Transcript_154232/g.287525  ORF Transcript_154232/g.287525 Transcript_154232/m.287525 type:complete len:546 (-) Transcript_154232:137-1774(-)
MGNCSTLEKHAPLEGSDVSSNASEAPPLLPRAQRVVDHRNDLEREYEIEGVMHQGKIGVIHRAMHKKLEIRRAVKQVRRSRVVDELWSEEVSVLKDFDHPHICRLYDTYKGASFLSQTMELCQGLNLMTVCETKQDMLTESVSAVLVWQMVSAINYLHGHSVCHGELGPECFMLSRSYCQTKPPLCELCLKLIDFGQVGRFGRSGKVLCTRRMKLRTKIECQAPEQLAGDGECEAVNGKPCDIWAVGAIALFLICGVWPEFNEHNQTVSMPGDRWKKASQLPKHFVKSCLKVVAEARPTASKLFSGWWMSFAKGLFFASLKEAHAKRQKQGGGKKKSITDAPLMDTNTILNDFTRMADQTDLERAAKTVVAHHLPEEKIKHLRQAFQKLDVNGDGQVTAAELRKSLKGSKYTPFSDDEISRLARQIDTDGSGKVDCTEFIASTYHFENNVRDSICEAAFRVFDKDNSGSVSVEEIQEILGRENMDPTDEDALEQLIGDADRDGNGEIDIEEFKRMLRGKGSAGLPEKREKAGVSNTRARKRIGGG